jgi:hypothetical protein
MPSAVRARIAQDWLEDARMEHASVAAFARFSLELLAFAAPAELVAQAQRAGLDEVAHARACFTLAQRYSGVACGPARLDLTGLSPASALTDAVSCAFLEGCVGETQAALQAERALQVVSDEPARSVLARIARDEARHALLAWQFVAWAVREDAACIPAIEAALARALSDAPRAALDREHSDMQAHLHAAGRLTARERVVVARDALSEVIIPCTRALLSAAKENSPRFQSKLICANG